MTAPEVAGFLQPLGDLNGQVDPDRIRFDDRPAASGQLSVAQALEDIDFLTEVSGIPVVESRTLAPYAGNAEALDRLVREARDWRGEPVVILDLRGNGGGSDLCAARWMEAFTGTSPSYGAVTVDLRTDTSLRLLLASANAMGVSDDLMQMIRERFSPAPKGRSEIPICSSGRAGI